MTGRYDRIIVIALIRERRGVPAIAADSGGSEEDVSHLPVSLRAHLAGSSKAPLRGASSQWRSGERGRTTMDPGRAQDPTCCAAINRPWFVHEGMRSNPRPRSNQFLRPSG